MNNSIFVENLKILTAYQRKNDNAKTSPADLEQLKVEREVIKNRAAIGYYNEAKTDILLSMLDEIEREAAEVIEINKSIKAISKEIRKQRKAAANV